MKNTLKETIISIQLKELEKIKKELTPHFEEFGTLTIHTINKSYVISIKYNNNYADSFVVRLYDGGYYDINYSKVYDVTGLNQHDIFEKVGEALEEVKIKPPKAFDIELWRNQFIKKYNLILDDFGYVCDTKGDIIILSNYDVSVERWNSGELKGHEKFKFDNDLKMRLKTKQDCLEFEQIFKNYIENIKYKTLKDLFPNLSTEERESIGLVFADIARSLNIDIMYDKAEEDYFCNAYRIDRDKADLILNLIKGENNAK